MYTRLQFIVIVLSSLVAMVLYFLSWFHCRLQYPIKFKYQEVSRAADELIDWTDYELIARESAMSGPGERGEAYYLESLADQEAAEPLIREHSYNPIVSDKISLNRSLPDTRPPSCLHRKYSKNLPAVSVIIIFHNEHLSLLLRTIYSVINRTPESLLGEILLVDDASTKTYLKSELEQKISLFNGKVKIHRLTKRSGLMKARTEGVLRAQNDIVIMMDAHMEVNTNWLPPLIEPIVKNYQVISEPVINWIDWGNLKYDSWTDVGVRGGFNWYLIYKYYGRSIENDAADNYANPVILGCIIAINKTYFHKLGGFDEGLEIWGAEQYQISWQAWTCGGQLIRVPCSHVGHNFKTGGHHPFFNKAKRYYYFNHNRVAEVFMDEFKNHYYSATRKRHIGYGNVSKQRAYRERHQCKQFSWFLENLFPEPLREFCTANLGFYIFVGLSCTLVALHVTFQIMSLKKLTKTL